MSLGVPKYDDTIIDYQEPHILRAPPRSVMFPRSESANPADISNELAESGDYIAEYINVIPTGFNPAVTVGYGGNAMTNNGWIKRYRKPGKAKGTISYEPQWAPEGGWAYDFEGIIKLPEDYYSELRRPVRYVDLPVVEEHSEDPLIVFPSTGKHRLKSKDIVPIVPTAVYDINQPERKDPAKIVYRSATPLLNITPDFNPNNPTNPLEITKYIQNKNITSILPPIYSTYLKIDDKVIPIRLKDSKNLVMQAYDSEPLNIPLPDGSTFKLKEYTWKVVQGIDAETELIFEIPTQLKNRPDVNHALSSYDSSYEKYVENANGRIVNKIKSDNVTAPIMTQSYNPYVQYSNVHELTPSKIYYNVDTGLEAIPSHNLQSVQVELRQKPNTYVQPEPNFTVPWLY